MADHPLRLPYARPGGPAADLAWADEQLAAAGRPRTGPAEQIKSWNLSSIWRLPTADGPVWLKVVPPFGHEGAMLRRLHTDVVPPLVAAEGRRVLLGDVPGEDHWGAELPVLERVVSMLVGLQVEWVDRVPELVEVGAPDWRAEAFVPAAERLLSVAGGELGADEASRLYGVVDGLPRRFARVAECGIPDTFVHGDFHPGNTRGSAAPGGRSVLLDWGDCGIGNPLLDQAATLASIREEQRDPLRAHWAGLWRDAVPGCDPDQAAELLGPVRALRQAMIYQVFLDGIEPDERVYHSGDPATGSARPRRSPDLTRAEQQGVEAPDQADSLRCGPDREQRARDVRRGRGAGVVPDHQSLVGECEDDLGGDDEVGSRTECTWVPATVAPRASGCPPVSATATASDGRDTSPSRSASSRRCRWTSGLPADA